METLITSPTIPIFYEYGILFIKLGDLLLLLVPFNPASLRKMERKKLISGSFSDVTIYVVEWQTEELSVDPYNQPTTNNQQPSITTPHSPDK